MKKLIIYISLLLFIFLSLLACGSSGEHNNAPDPVPAGAVQKFLTMIISLHSDGTQGDDNSSAPVISSDGAFIAFESTATNLIDNDLNGLRDIFVHNRNTGVTERVSVDSNGFEANDRSLSPSISISDDGSYAVFESDATNLVTDDLNGLRDIFLRDRNP